MISRKSIVKILLSFVRSVLLKKCQRMFVAGGSCKFRRKVSHDTHSFLQRCLEKEMSWPVISCRNRDQIFYGEFNQFAAESTLHWTNEKSTTQRFGLAAVDIIDKCECNLAS